MKTTRWAPGGAAVVGVLLLAGCYGNWLFGIVESFGTPNAAKIATVAGNGKAAYAGDGGAATSAELNSPSGVAVDTAGNLYIADTNNSRIRKVAPDGTITTVIVLGPTVSPLTVAVDSSASNLYFDDSNNNQVWKLPLSSGIPAVFAGTGTAGSTGDGGAPTSAQLNFPTGVAVDGAGNVYIADFYNCVIREVAVADGNIHTVAGNKVAGYSGDGGLAVSAKLNYPYGVAVDSSGNLYVADTTNNVIRKVVNPGPIGIISTVAGNGLGGYSGDGGPAASASLSGPTGVSVDAAGNLYIADRLNNVIRKVDPSETINSVAGNWHLGGGFVGDGNVATAAMLNLPWGLAFDSTGNLYIADTHNHRIRKVDK
jgi:sugar lactone lactonase YvrE